MASPDRYASSPASLIRSRSASTDRGSTALSDRRNRSSSSTAPATARCSWTHSPAWPSAASAIASPAPIRSAARYCVAEALPAGP